LYIIRFFHHLKRYHRLEGTVNYPLLPLKVLLSHPCPTRNSANLSYTHHRSSRSPLHSLFTLILTSWYFFELVVMILLKTQFVLSRLVCWFLVQVHPVLNWCKNVQKIRNSWDATDLESTKTAQKWSTICNCQPTPIFWTYQPNSTYSKYHLRSSPSKKQLQANWDKLMSFQRYAATFILLIFPKAFRNHQSLS
jgi:hypothetical protein